MAEPVTPLEALEAEAEAPPGPVGYRLATSQGEAVLAVPSPNAWRASARSALADQVRVDGDIAWARSVLSAEDFETYLELDPTPEEASAFLTRIFSRNGESLGKSEPSTGSSRSTRKR